MNYMKLHPKMQKKGIGTKLLLEIENEYPNQKAVWTVFELIAKNALDSTISV